MIDDVSFDGERLRAICSDFEVLRLGVFGSVIHGDSRPDSDLDVLVVFQPEAKIGLKFITLQSNLSELFGRKVDLNTPGFLSPRFRDQVIRETVSLYDAA